MATPTKKRSRVLDEVLEGARGLNRLGFIDKRRMTEYEALCLPPIPAYDSARIRALRRRLGA